MIGWFQALGILFPRCQGAGWFSLASQMAPTIQSIEPLLSVWLSFPARFYFQLCVSVGDEGWVSPQTHIVSRIRRMGTGTISRSHWRTFCYASFARLCTSRWHWHWLHSLESWTWVSLGEIVSCSGSSSSLIRPRTQRALDALCSLSLKEEESVLWLTVSAPPIVMPNEVRSSSGLCQGRSSCLWILATELIWKTICIACNR